MRYSDQIHPKTIRQLLLLAIVLGMAFVLYREMYFMLGAFMGAMALYTLMRIPMFTLVYKWKWKKSLSALLLLVISLMLIVLPLAWVVNVLITEFRPLITDTTQLEKPIYEIDAYLKAKYGFVIINSDLLKRIPGYAANIGAAILGATLSTVTNVVIMYFLLYFMLVSSGNMERWLRHNIPLKNTNVNKLLTETREVVLSNTIGIPVLGAVQGMVAMIGYYMFGIEKYILWGVITGITSVIPFVGTMAAWVPLTIFTFAKGDTTNGYWLTFWGFFVIGTSDNIFRFILQKYIADIHPLITVFGVIVGLNMFGFLGLIFGPLLISLFLLMARIYYDEFVSHHPPENSGKQGPDG